MNTNRKTALVTGASGGIGLDLARLFARDGYRVILVARSEDKLRRYAAELGGESLVADLTRPEAPREIYDRVGEVDALVNNAGFGMLGPFAEGDEQRQIEMLQVNIVALTHLTRLFLPGMLKRRSGALLNVASTAAFQPGPLMAMYYATKAYVLWLTEAIADEVRDSGVLVSALCPGPTATGFAESASMETTRLFKVFKPASSAAVAKAGYEGLFQGRRIVIPGLRNKLIAQSVRLSPRRVVTTIARRFQEHV